MIALLLAAALGLPSSPAQEAAAVSPDLSFVDAVDPDGYVLGPGDVLWISLPGGLPYYTTEENPTGISILNVTVTPDGNVVIPVVGAVDVSGLTLTEACGLIERTIASYYRGVRPQIGLASPRRFRLPVSGQVASPGMHCINGVTTLWETLSQAGGLLPTGSLSGIEVIHSSGDTTVIDMGRFLIDGDMSANPVLSLGDRVHVPMATRLVYVEGAVRGTGGFGICRTDEEMWLESSQVVMEHIEGQTVSEALARAGGLTPWAEREACHILRRSGEGEPGLRIDAELENPLLDPVLMPGDRVIVPGTSPTVAVTGHVNAPGSYPYVAMRDYMYYVGLAGGFDDRASRGGTRLLLADGSVLPADEAGAVPSGAIVEVPQKSIVWWQDYLLILTGVASVVIAYKSIL
ncbi:SLBB domain-containing protein [Candidatus Fermentibacterales bacterium]|nr:SLBB domain-containing protein [Candidatus Fermentibacterales bacterium]